MTDFLLELRSEEIPARMQVKAKGDLARLFAEKIAKAGLTADSIETFATPRRLALIARGLPDETQAVSEERKGPRANAPEQALAGFLRSTGLTRDRLIEREGVFFARIDTPGRATADVLAQAIPAIIRVFPWPKSMRWGDASSSTESLRWVRPLQGIVALFGENVVPCEVGGIVSGTATMGHRFHHSGPITIGSANDYVEKLRACHVIVHLSERCRLIEEGAAQAAAAAGLTVITDEGLVIENAGLTEWPVPLLGRFDRAFLDVPREVIQLTMRTNQKYFACADADGKLANAFVCTANLSPSDGGAAVIAGNEKVLSARLSDAKFFWEQDLKVPIADQAAKLSQIVFHEKLGTVADKVERVAKLAEWLATENIVPRCDPGLARQAAELCKADLVTGMVGEFPELQGIMGGHYARAQGHPDAVADAIRDHYKPVGQGDDVPIAPVTVAVSLADKLDTLVSLNFAGERATGSSDPFALRRAAVGVIALLLGNGLRIALRQTLVDVWAETNRTINKYLRDPERAAVVSGIVDILPTVDDLDPLKRARVDIATCRPDFLEMYPRASSSWDYSLNFLIDRLKVQQREAGVRHDLIDAVFALGGEDDLVRLLARVKALQRFVGTDEGKNLLSGYKRAANILKKEAWNAAERVTPDQVRGDVEGVLIDALNVAEPRAAAAIEREDFEAAMSALASLRAPIDAFFEGLMVNDPDPDIRTFRLSLLARFRDAVHSVADFSKIEG